MRDDQRNYIVVGAFVIAMLVGLVAWIAVLAGRTGATDEYHLHLANVMGLSTGTQVLYEGYAVGMIEDIRPVTKDGRQLFRLDVNVKRGWRIPEDSVAGITASGLLAAVVVNIDAGRSATLLDPGAEIPSAEAPDLFATMSAVAGEVGEILEQSLRPMLASLAEGGPAVVDDLQTFTQQLNQTLNRVDKLVSGENGRRIESILGNLETSSQHFAALSGELEQTRLRIDELLASVNGLIEENRAQVGHSVTDLHESLEAVSRHMEAITHNLEVTTRNMNEFSRQIRENPGVIIRGRSPAEDPS